MKMPEKNNKNQKKKSSDKPSSRKLAKEEASEKLIESALQSHLLEYAEKKASRKRTIDDTLNLVNEHLSSFIILGYDYNGNPMQCINVNTQQEADSLCSLVNKFVLQHSNPLM
jgi:hypothetical protein